MPQALTETGLSKLFKQIENCAALGVRCPQKEPHGPLTNAGNRGLSELARRGRIRLEIYPHNWRVVVMCEGPHRGKHTELPPPLGTNKPWKIIQKGDLPASQRTMPSLPRLLTDPRNSDAHNKAPRGPSG